jgi:4-hydroxybenzoate polyprenyltransferase
MQQRTLEGQTIGGAGRLVDYSNLVKLPHTVFALPFALVGATLASYRYPVRPTDLVWILIAFTAARFAAMGFNRVVDRAIDARNPRTRGREIPAGKLSVRQASVAVGIASALFVFAAGMLNPLCLVLAPFALGWVFFYSYTKRFTRWAHLVLGFALAIAPVGAYLAISGEWSQPRGRAARPRRGRALLGGGLRHPLLAAGRGVRPPQGLHSVPAAFGARGAIRIVSRALHLACVALFVAHGMLFPELGRSTSPGSR